VRFDDGDLCDDLLPENVFSEFEYRHMEQKDPPEVINSSAPNGHNHVLHNLHFCRKWIGLSPGTYIESISIAHILLTISCLFCRYVGV
jgi:hypothetical protein